MRVVVTGGLGALGSRVVEQLRELGHEAVPVSRRTGVDLTSGAGLDAALEGAGAVVHTADTTSPRQFEAVTVGATRTVLDAVGRTHEPAHLVTISIVGVDRVGMAYYRAKRRADGLVLASRQPATVVRATQFHSLSAYFARLLTLGPLALDPGGLRIQPVDIGWVAQRLAETAVGPRPDGAHLAPHVTGPDVFDAATITRLVAAHRGRRAPRPLRLPAPVAALRAVADGALLAGPDAEVGGETFETWLSAQPARLRGR